MTAIRAFIPTEHYSETDTEKTNNSDKFGGYEMGTWEFPPYLQWLWGLGINCNYCRMYYFNPRECSIIVASLKTAAIYEGKEGTGRIIPNSITPFTPKGLVLIEKWYNRLVELFSRGDVVYYTR